MSNILTSLLQEKFAEHRNK